MRQIPSTELIQTSSSALPRTLRVPARGYMGLCAGGPAEIQLQFVSPCAAPDGWSCLDLMQAPVSASSPPPKQEPFGEFLSQTGPLTTQLAFRLLDGLYIYIFFFNQNWELFYHGIRTSHCLTRKIKKCKGGLTLEAFYPPSAMTSQTTSERGRAGTTLTHGPQAEETGPATRAQCCQVQNCSEPSALSAIQPPSAGCPSA